MDITVTEPDYNTKPDEWAIWWSQQTDFFKDEYMRQLKKRKSNKHKDLDRQRALNRARVQRYRAKKKLKPAAPVDKKLEEWRKWSKRRAKSCI